MQALRSLQILIFITALTVTCALAQKKQKDVPQVAPCPVQQSPSLRGFRLGMPLMDVKGALEDASLFDSKISGGNSVGSRAVRIQGAELKGNNAEGVDDVDLVFVDDRLSNIKVNFNSGMRWDSASDFFTRMSETLGLPKPAGEDSSTRGSNQRNQKYTVECASFSVTLAYSFGVSPSVAISDTLAQKKVGDRRANTDEGEIRNITISPGGKTRQPPK
ncbi:MAG TPA: hypothetical protein VGC66_25465 [Pyrinomonadaceae bacterium]|jgi:hypothetical protein